MRVLIAGRTADLFTDDAVIVTFPGPGSPTIVVRDAAGDQAVVPIGLSNSP